MGCLGAMVSESRRHVKAARQGNRMCHGARTTCPARPQRAIDNRPLLFYDDADVFGAFLPRRIVQFIIS